MMDAKTLELFVALEKAAVDNFHSPNRDTFTALMDARQALIAHLTERMPLPNPPEREENSEI